MINESGDTMLSEMRAGESLVIKKLGSGDALSWLQAAYLYDHGDASMVAIMIERDHTGMLLEDNVKRFLASVVTGARRCAIPKGYKGEPKERLSALLRVLYISEILAVLQSVKICQEMAQDFGEEPADLIATWGQIRHRLHERNRDHIGVGETALKKDLAEFRKRIKKYPDL
ncbi:hypothetical protein CWI75_10750 [Kineobactrum sediminis]|uniref:Uncharacterized protein n=1 Tax=Kineobactrum sediminis TaxID=1905677 RepID=A0A2N5Y1K7_9GAMM|nr:hypothetical protein [Kineobactrum sediminis]PLW82249.1 hypothetical protein CWI75_10750 [Kineobactrum sediminis]